MLLLQSPPEPVLPPNPENVAHVAQVAAYQIEPAIGVVTPADRQLLDPVSQPSRDGQNLHVEHVAVDLLPAKQLLGDGTLEKLEPALGVLDPRQADHRPHKPAESHRSNAPVERLRPLDDGGAAPRPDRHIDACRQHGTELVEILDGHLVIGVGIADDRAGCDGHRLAYAEPFAAPRIGAGGDERRSGDRHFAHDFAGAVGAIGCHDNLVAQAAAFEVANRFADGHRNDAGLIVRRQNQTDLWSHFKEGSLYRSDLTKPLSATLVLRDALRRAAVRRVRSTLRNRCDSSALPAEKPRTRLADFRLRKLGYLIT